MIKELTDAERKQVQKMVGSRQNKLEPWPDKAPRQYNAVSDPCDMWTGHCACGAYHTEGR